MEKSDKYWNSRRNLCINIMKQNLRIIKKWSHIIKSTFELYFFFINWFNTSIHMRYLDKSCISNVMLEWLLSFVNWFIMPIHMIFSGKTFVTNFTLEWDFPATARVWVWISCTHSCLDCLSRRVRIVYKHEWRSHECL